MILEAMADFDIDPAGSVLYGDCDSDIEAARRCGIKGMLMEPINDGMEIIK
jgi:D-glycero-D-manno-heptose 1,7-bisphosphate phosphatase